MNCSAHFFCKQCICKVKQVMQPTEVTWRIGATSSYKVSLSWSSLQLLSFYINTLTNIRVNLKCFLVMPVKKRTILYLYDRKVYTTLCSNSLLFFFWMKVNVRHDKIAQKVLYGLTANIWSLLTIQGLAIMHQSTKNKETTMIQVVHECTNSTRPYMATGTKNGKQKQIKF